MAKPHPVRGRPANLSSREWIKRQIRHPKDWYRAHPKQEKAIRSIAGKIARYAKPVWNLKYPPWAIRSKISEIAKLWAWKIQTGKEGEKMVKWLSGKKTYAVALTVAVVAVLEHFGIKIPEYTWEILAALGLGFLRSGIKKAEM